jgi:glutaredoxin 2
MQEQTAKAQNALQKKRESDPEYSKKLRKDIEQYINEVDKCIEWLQKS